MVARCCGICCDSHGERGCTFYIPAKSQVQFSRVCSRRLSTCGVDFPDIRVQEIPRRELTVAQELRRRCAEEDRELPESVQPFVERYAGPNEDVQLPLSIRP